MDKHNYRRYGGVASSLGGLIAFLLIPKCPLCLAALLGVAGLSAGAASLVAPYLRPVCCVWRWRRRSFPSRGGRGGRAPAPAAARATESATAPGQRATHGYRHGRGEDEWIPVC